MSEFRYSRDFAAPADAIWPYLEDPDKIKLWMTGIVEDRPTSEGPPGVGSTFEVDIKEGRKVVTYQGEITEYDVNQHMVVKMVGGCGKKPMTMYADYRLEKLSDGRTRLDYAARVEVPNSLMFKLMMPLFKLMGRAMVKKFMKNLAGLVEQKAGQATG